MGKLKGFQLDDEVVETDTLKYTISSTTGFVLLLRITTKKPAPGQRSPVSAVLWWLCSSKLSFTIDISVFRKVKRWFLSLRLLAWWNQRAEWQSRRESPISLLHVTDMALVFELWLWEDWLNSLLAVNTAVLLELKVPFRKLRSSTLTFSNSGDVSPITPRCPREEQTQDESESLTQSNILWVCACPNQIKTLKSDPQSQILQRVLLRFFIPRKASCFVCFWALKGLLLGWNQSWWAHMLAANEKASKTAGD